MAVWTTATRTWAAGENVTATNLNAQLRDFANAFGPWGAYTPTLTGFTQGNGTLTGAYMQVQKQATFRATFVFGTTSAAAAAVPTFTLPVTSTAVATGSPFMLGTATFRDDSAAAMYLATLRHISTTTCAAGIIGTNGLQTAPSTTSPFTWTSSDVVHATAVYEAA